MRLHVAVLSIVLLILVLKRLGERYTSYVITNVRIMRISGIISRRAHSIPWVRVTDLTYEQSLSRPVVRASPPSTSSPPTRTPASATSRASTTR